MILSKQWQLFKERFLLNEVAFESADLFKQRIQPRTIITDVKIVQPFSEVGELEKLLLGKPGQFYARQGMTAENIFGHQLVEAEAGYVHEKNQNPHDVLSANLFPSGMSAIESLIRYMIRDIPHNKRAKLSFLQANTLYYNSSIALSQIASQDFGINPAIKVDITNPSEIEKKLQQNKGKIIAIFYETVSNPLMEYANTKIIAQIAKKYNVPVIVDNTFLTPYLLQPFSMGADFVVHSLTKYANGYCDSLGGAVIGPKEEMIKLRDLQRTTGAVMQSPEIIGNFSHRFAQLPNRMDKHILYAQSFNDFLISMDKYIENVNFPQLTDSRYNSPGAVMSFVLNGNSDEEKKLHEARLMQYLIQHPDGPIKYQVSLGEEKHLMFGESTYGKNTAMPPGLVRFAVGRNPSARNCFDFLRNAFGYSFKK